MFFDWLRCRCRESKDPPQWQHSIVKPDGFQGTFEDGLLSCPFQAPNIPQTENEVVTPYKDLQSVEKCCLGHKHHFENLLVFEHSSGDLDLEKKRTGHCIFGWSCVEEEIKEEPLLRLFAILFLRSAHVMHWLLLSKTFAIQLCG